MNKWEVYQCLSPGGRRQWCAMTRADYWSDRYFDTHAEALEYADARARTVEVVVPRGGQPGWSCQVDYDTNDLLEWITLGSADDRICTATRPVKPEFLLSHCALILWLVWCTQNAIDRKEE